MKKKDKLKRFLEENDFLKDIEQVSGTSKEIKKEQIVKAMKKIHNKISKVDFEISCKTNFSIRDHKNKN